MYIYTFHKLQQTKLNRTRKKFEMVFIHKKLRHVKQAKTNDNFFRFEPKRENDDDDGDGDDDDDDDVDDDDDDDDDADGDGDGDDLGCSPFLLAVLNRDKRTRGLNPY